MSLPTTAIDGIRSASRTIVRELGFMQPTLAGTAYSASAVHTLIEIDTQGEVTAAHLIHTLGLEKSSVSRMLAKLVAAGDIAETATQGDARLKQLTLTAQGQALVAEIHAYGRRQVTSALAYLNPSQQQAVLQGLAAYAQALTRSRAAHTDPAHAAAIIVPGYRPGLIGRIAEMHAAFYARHAGFGQYFESQVASGVAEFAGRLHEPCNQVWTAIQHERIVGAIAIDGQDLGHSEGQGPGQSERQYRAHLRWFILDDGCRGSGVGRQLLNEALQFCDSFGFTQCHLWTFQGLDAARRLYETAGFTLVHEAQGQQWGSIVTEQEFVRQKPATPQPEGG